jgi:hypothetical protein
VKVVGSMQPCGPSGIEELCKRRELGCLPNKSPAVIWSLILVMGCVGLEVVDCVCGGGLGRLDGCQEAIHSGTEGYLCVR